MKPGILALVTSLLLATLACGLISPSAPDQTGIATSVAATLQALAAANTPAPSVEFLASPTSLPATAPSIPPTAQSGSPVSFQNVSFVIPAGLADNANSETVPEMNETNSDPWSIAPEHTLIKLTGYPITREGFGPLIHIYPADQYFSVNPGAENSLSRLRAILASPTAPLTNDKLSRIPFFNAAQLYAAQASRLTFKSGEGLRMISESAQYPAPITSDLSYYHFEGLTFDGKYFIVAIFPVIVPLQATQENPGADGITFPADMGDNTGFETYYLAITERLNSASPESFQPSLTNLDALIQSIQMK